MSCSHLGATVAAMDGRERTAWVLRRAGFGPAPGEFDDAAAAGPEVTLDRLVNPDGHGIDAAADPWDDELLADPDPGAARRARWHAVDGWLERMRTTPRPLEERMAWLWHDHFATAIDKVKYPALMVGQIRALQRLALGAFPELVKAMTMDAAMLVWLDGSTSVARAPNENYGRELLELFTVGLGAHTEADVAAAARALTGWRVDRRRGVATFVGRRHDDRPQLLLGRGGVHDVETVVDSVCSSSACAPFVTTALVGHLLGPAVAGDESLVAGLAADFAENGLEIRPLVAAILAAGLGRDDTAVVEAPVPWLVRAQRATGARLASRTRLTGLFAAGQLPLRPPDVGGWPDHTAWLSSSAVTARASMATQVAAVAPTDGPARTAARTRDLDALADVLGRPEGFSAATAAALRSSKGEVETLAVALTAPDQVVI